MGTNDRSWRPHTTLPGPFSATCFTHRWTSPGLLPCWTSTTSQRLCLTTATTAVTTTCRELWTASLLTTECLAVWERVCALQTQASTWHSTTIPGHGRLHLW